MVEAGAGVEPASRELRSHAPEPFRLPRLDKQPLRALTTPALVSVPSKIHTRAGFVFLPSASVSWNAGAFVLLIASHPFVANFRDLVESIE